MHCSPCIDRAAIDAANQRIDVEVLLRNTVAITRFAVHSRHALQKTVRLRGYPKSPTIHCSNRLYPQNSP
jgi:hypothetical protein